MEWYSGTLPPDVGLCVLIHCPGESEPVWLGYHDDAAGEWITAEGNPVYVQSWAPLPEPPAEETEALESGRVSKEGAYSWICACGKSYAAESADAARHGLLIHAKHCRHAEQYTRFRL